LLDDVRLCVTWRVRVWSASLQVTNFQPAGLETVWQVQGSKQQV